MNDYTLITPITLKIFRTEGYRNISTNSIDILFCAKGKVKLTTGGSSYVLNLYDIVVINPYEPYEISKGKEESTLIQIRINRSLLNLSQDFLNARFICNSCKYPHKEKFSSLYLLIYSFIKDYNNKTYLQNLSSAYSFYDELLNNFTELSKEVKGLDFNSILNYIEINYDQDLLLKDIADAFNLSVPYLSKKFKDAIGKNFNDYYDEIRISHASYDLFETSMSITDIAYKHGFSSSQAYLRAFKRVNGILPSEARKESPVSAQKVIESTSYSFEEIANEFKAATQTTKPYKVVDVSINYNQPIMMQSKNVSNMVLGIGSARGLLFKNFQDILEKVQSETKFKYAHIKGLFSDELSFLKRDEYGELSFNFSLINNVLDLLDGLGLYPMIDLIYLPSAISSDPKRVVFERKYNVSLPKYMDEWKYILKTSLNHFIKRYGKDVVKNWIIIPWFHPDSAPSQFGFENKEDFFFFYETTYKTLKETLPDLTVASPELFPINEKRIDYLNNFLKYSMENNCFPDILSVMFYANENIDDLEIQNLSDLSKLHFITKMSSNPNLMNKYLRRIYQELDELKISIPVWLTEFNYTILHNHLLLDTLFAPNYIVKNYLDNFNLISSYGYWHLTDAEDSVIRDGGFYGGTGLFTHKNHEKPAFNVFKYLNRIGDEIISIGNNHFITKMSNEPNSYYIILMNYEYPSNEFDINVNDRYNVFFNSERNKVKLTISSLPFTKMFLREFSINKYHGSPFDRWLLMGKPENNAYHRGVNIIDEILNASILPDYKELYSNINDGIFEYETNVDPLEIKGIKIDFY